jgi:hypothetical protein
MWSIDSVAHVGNCAQRLEAVQESGRDVKVPELAVVEKKSFLPAEGRRVPTDVDQDIVDSSVGAAHQLCFASACTAVHTADDSLLGSRLGVLNERSGAAWRANIVIEHVRVESPCEQTAFVAAWLRDKGENIGEGCFFDTHMEMLA